MKNNSQYDDRRVFSLTELCESIQSIISKTYKNSFWIRAEIVKLNYYPKSGHCYPDFVHKKDGKILSQLRGFLHGNDFQKIQKSFKDLGHEGLKSGMSILMLAQVQYYPIHGLSVLVKEVDTHFTLGEMAKNRMQTIKRLVAENVFYTNKHLKTPLLAQKIAIISVDTSKGFQDFIQVLEKRASNFNFEISLFPALLQGDAAVDSISFQLDKIQDRLSYFDVVCIIRGGGGEIGLDCYDSYKLAKKIATFPLPVLAGIGHVSNITVSEQVAHKHFITPTDLAYFFVDKFIANRDLLINLEKRFTTKVKEFSHDEKEELHFQSKFFQKVVQARVQLEKRDITKIGHSLVLKSQALLYQNKSYQKSLVKDLKLSVNYLIQRNKEGIGDKEDQIKKIVSTEFQEEKRRLENLQTIINLVSPQKVLQRGYSITTFNGKVISELNKPQIGDTIQIESFDSRIDSEVKNIKHGKKENKL